MADLEHLIDTSMLQVFGENTVVPLGQSIVSLSGAVGAIDERVEVLEQNGGGSGGGISRFYGTCDTAASTAEKAVTCSNFELATGVSLMVKFTNANTKSAPTLKINNGTAIAIKYVGTSNAVAYCWQAGEIVNFVYDGTNWVIADGAIANTVYYGVTKLSSAVDSTSNSLAATAGAVKQAYDLASSKAVKPTIVSISLSSAWQGSNPYTQTVTVSGGTANSAVDLRPDAAVIAALLTSGCKALYVENNNGTFTAYAIGNKPNSALTVQATVTEVSA